MVSMGVACSDQTGQTGGVVEMLAVVDRVVGSSDDSAGMYYNGNLVLYYYQESEVCYNQESVGDILLL